MAQVWEKEVPQPEPMTLREAPVDEVLAELAYALRLTGMTWPRQHEESYVEWRSLAWARCSGHLTDLDSEPMPDVERARLIDDFVTAGAADDDVTRSVADLFLDYADSYLASGHLCWSPVAVQLLLSDWMPRKAILDADQRAAVPELLPRWVRFCLARRGVEPEWIQPIVDAVGESLPYFEEAFDDERAWGPAKQMVAEFEKLGVDLTDQAAVDDAISEVNAARLARRLLED